MIFIDFSEFSESWQSSKMSGYQRQYLSGNKHITSGSNTKRISINYLGLVSVATHPIEQILNQRLWKFIFYYCLKEYICCEVWTVSGNHTTFGFSQDSLNSIKAIHRKLKCLAWRGDYILSGLSVIGSQWRCYENVVGDKFNFFAWNLVNWP